jgi:hypothetical protein
MYIVQFYKGSVPSLAPFVQKSPWFLLLSHHHYYSTVNHVYCLTQRYHLKYMTPEAVIEKLMVGVSPNLYWTCQRNKIEWKRLRRDQIGNPLTLSTFFPPDPRQNLFRHPFQISAIPLLARHFCYSSASRHFVIFCNSFFHMAFPSLRILSDIFVFPLPDGICVNRRPFLEFTWHFFIFLPPARLSVIPITAHYLLSFRHPSTQFSPLHPSYFASLPPFIILPSAESSFPLFLNLSAIFAIL